ARHGLRPNSRVAGFSHGPTHRLERERHIVLDCDDAALCGESMQQYTRAEHDIARPLAHQHVVTAYVRLAFHAVENQMRAMRLHAAVALRGVRKDDSAETDDPSLA